MHYRVLVEWLDGRTESWDDARNCAVDPHVRVLIVTDKDDNHLFLPLDCIRKWTKKEVRIVQ